MNKRLSTVAVGSAAALALLAGPALAAVDFSPTAGGFAGKGDVQLLFDWNDKLLQSNGGGLRFHYVASETYSFTCTFSVQTGGTRNTETKVMTPTRSKTADVNATIAYETKGSKKITGFILAAAGEGTTSGDDIPADGESCPGGNVGDGVVSGVTLTDSSGGLTVTHGSTTYDLPNTPVL